MTRAVVGLVLVLVCYVVGCCTFECASQLADTLGVGSAAPPAEFQSMGQPFQVHERLSITNVTVKLALANTLASSWIYSYNPNSRSLVARLFILVSSSPLGPDVGNYVLTTERPVLTPGHYAVVLTSATGLQWGANDISGFVNAPAISFENTHYVSEGTLGAFALAITIAGCTLPYPPSPQPVFGGTFDPLEERLSPWFGAAVPSFGILVPQDTPPVGVQSAFSELVYAVNNESALLGDYVVEKTVGDNSTTVSYTAVIDSNNQTTLEQSFTFFAVPTTKSFDGVAFNITQSSVKWSLRLVTTSASSSSSFAEGVTLRYSLGSLNITSSSSSLGIQQGLPKVVKRSREPVDFMTTYYLLTDVVIKTSQGAAGPEAVKKRQLMAKVEVLDVALADGVRVPLLNHSLITVPNEADNSTAFVLELQFAGFNTSLEYDPSVGLGQLLGTDARKSQGSETSTGLIVGVSVGVGVAVLVVVSVLVVGAVLIPLVKRRMRTNLRQEVNLGELEEENGRGDTHAEL